MARGLFRKPSFWKIVGAYRSQWKRFWLRLFSFGTYGKKGIGWCRNPKKAWYNFWYHRTSVSLPHLLGYKPSRFATFCALIVASAAGIVVAPMDATQAGIKIHKANIARKEQANKERSISHNTSNGDEKQIATTKTIPASIPTSYNYTPQTHKAPEVSERQPRTVVALSRPIKPTTTVSHDTLAAKQAPPKVDSKIADTPTIKKNDSSIPTCTEKFSLFKQEPTNVGISLPLQEIAEPDENAPKSKPKHEKDQYIKKRMIIAGSSYCDKAVLDKLVIGSYLELISEPTNPYDKDAIMLMHNGEKIGYIAKQDKFAFVTCLRLGRKIYGVITDIDAKSYPTRYEYETWFDLG